MRTDRTHVTSGLPRVRGFEGIEPRTIPEHNGIIDDSNGLTRVLLIQGRLGEQRARVQRYWVGSDETAREISLPAPQSEVVAGIHWGRADTLDTPAYWALRCAVEDNPLRGFTSATGSLIEEIGFCLLGGFGITAELNGAAFERLKSAGVFNLNIEMAQDSIAALLKEPLEVRGRPHRYRFPNQRAARLSAMRRSVRGLDLEEMPRIWIRALLRSIPGIGPKTAAWIIRNHFDCDDVAILDVHVIRACTRLHLFPDTIVLPRDYERLEERFLMFARALQVRPAVLDAVMWTDMRNERTPRRRLAA